APEPGPLLEVAGTRLGVSICEDLWNDKQFWKQPRYLRDPIEELAAKGAELLVNVSASPYAMGKPEVRRRMVSAAARRHGLPIAMCNLVGGNDSLVFDGRSLLVRANGELQREAAAFREDLIVEELAPGTARRTQPAGRTPRASVIPDQTAETSAGALAVVAGYDAGRSGLVGGARAGVRRMRGPGDWGEPEGAHTRYTADGMLEQDRGPADHDRKQERAGDRVLHAVRRHGGWARCHRRPLEDGRVRPGALVQPAGAGADPLAHPHPAAHGGAARAPDGPGHAAPLRRAGQ